MIYKRGKSYWYKFMWNGKPIRESTKQGLLRKKKRSILRLRVSRWPL
jgi:hypothetical protein